MTPIAAERREARTRKKLFDWKLIFGILVVLGLLAASLSVGEYDILTTDDGWEMFAATRIPRTIALVLAGAAMAMSGLVMQLLTQNRFVEPTILTGVDNDPDEPVLNDGKVAPKAGILTYRVLATDMAMGRTAGVDTALVLSGVTDRQMLEASDVRPTLVLESIAEVP